MSKPVKQPVVLRGWQRYLVRFAGYMSEEDRAKIGLAYRMGKEGHRGQYRGDGVTYYFKHCRDLGDMISCELGLKYDWQINVVPFIHDMVEDLEHVSLDLIQEIFGSRVRYWVDLLTKGEGYKKDKASYTRRLRESREISAIILKLADRVVNLRTLGMVPNENFQVKQINETVDYYLDLADSLMELIKDSAEWANRIYVGIHLKAELETQIASYRAEYGNRIH